MLQRAVDSRWSPGTPVLIAPEDASPSPILQWFESSYRTIEERTADLFLAGYGFAMEPSGTRNIQRLSVTVP